MMTAEDMEARAAESQKAARAIQKEFTPIRGASVGQLIQHLQADLVLSEHDIRRDNWLIAAEQCRRDEHMIDALQALADVFRKGK